jgi:Fe-S cluster assembly scaffold protein SufB
LSYRKPRPELSGLDFLNQQAEEEIKDQRHRDVMRRLRAKYRETNVKEVKRHQAEIANKSRKKREAEEAERADTIRASLQQQVLFNHPKLTRESTDAEVETVVRAILDRTQCLLAQRGKQ